MPRRILFTSAPLPGHLDWGGYLKTAAHLSRAGHSVVWVSQEPIRASVEATGVKFRAVAATGWRWPSRVPSSPASVRARYQRALDVSLTEEAVARAAENLISVASEFTPDVIVGEPFIWAAAIASEKLGVPYAVCGYPRLRPEGRELTEPERAVAEDGAARLRRLFDRFGVSGCHGSGGLSPWPQSPDLHVVYWAREWYADIDDDPPQTQFVGGAVSPPVGEAPAWFDQIPRDAPLAFITLGSTFTDDPAFFVLAAHASVRAGLFPLIAMGRSARAPNLQQQIAPRLPQCIALSWLDYDHVFPHLSVAIHHGGLGTTHAAVVHGVPQVIIPHAADQSLQARRAEANGVGLQIAPGAARIDSLRQAIETVIHDPGFRIRAQNLATAFARAGGVPHAAERIAALADRAKNV